MTEHTKISPNDTGEGLFSPAKSVAHPQGSSPAKGKAHVLVVVDPRYLERESFVRYVSMTNPESEAFVVGASSVEAWQSQNGGKNQDATILLNIGSRNLAATDCSAFVKAEVEKARPTPVVVLGESEDICDAFVAFDCGAYGYLSTSVGIDDIVQAARLVGAGGMFLPRSCVSVLREALSARQTREPMSKASEVFTGRQLEVCNELRLGKSNKIIAHDLTLCESTVKVHIRNIMKKLNATNRTQAAFKLHKMYFQDDDRPARTISRDT